MSAGIFHNNFPQVVELEKSIENARYIIGVDLHKKTTAISVLDVKKSDRPIFQRKRLKNEKLLETIKSFEGKKIVVAEASYGWIPLKDAIDDENNITMVLFDPRKTSAWIETSGIKSDTVDAEILAYALLRGGAPRLAVYQSSKEARESFKLANLREQLVRQKTRIKNQLKALNRDYGINTYTGEVPKKSEVVQNMENLLLDHLNFVHKKITGIDQHIKQEVRHDSLMQLLQSIPGIGVLTSFVLRHKMVTINRFEDAKHLCSYFGFAIRQHQSGEHMWKGKITKTGNSLVRKLLIQGAQVIRHCHPEYIKLYFPNMAGTEAMKNRIHANKVVTALARKQLVFVFHCWKNQQPFSLDEYQRRRNNHDIAMHNHTSKTAELV